MWFKDNIDVNSKANFNKSSYDGTISSMIQLEATNNEGKKINTIPSIGNISQDKKKLVLLPAEYTLVKDLYPAHLKMDFEHMLLLCVTKRIFILWHSSYWRDPVAHYLCKKSLTRILQSIFNLSPLDGMDITHHRNVAYKLHKYQSHSSIITR